jgi:hypothetical protein
MVDESTQVKFTNFFQTKDGMIEHTYEQFQQSWNYTPWKLVSLEPSTGL